MSEIADRIAKAYKDEQIDSVYLIFNEFKSVIAQRLIAQRILPVQEFGRREVALAEEFSLEERERMGEAARSAGISTKEPEPTEMEAEAAKFATAPVDYIYEQSPDEIFADLLPRYLAFEIFEGMLESVAAENAARMTAMESASNNANDVIDSLDADHEPRTPGDDHERNYRDRQRSSSACKAATAVGDRLSAVG